MNDGALFDLRPRPPLDAMHSLLYFDELREPLDVYTVPAALMTRLVINLKMERT